MKQAIRFAYFLGLSAVIFSSQACNTGTPAEPKKGGEEPKKDSAVVEEPKIEIDKKYNDVARILAGMEIEPDSDFYSVTQTETWKKYKKSADEGWAMADDKRFNAMRTWAQA